MVKYIRRYLIACILVAVASNIALAQYTVAPEPQRRAPYIQRQGEIDIFCGLDFNYRDITFDRQYDILINLTPGIKWMPWRYTLIEAQAWIPTINQYGKHFKVPRINILSISQEMKANQLAWKPSIGIFSQERWGLDIKAMYPLKAWVALEAEIGYTGYLSMTEGWKMSKLSRGIVLPGIDFFFSRWDSQLRLYGGRFLHDDKGIVLEAMRHFRHYSLEVYAEYSDKGIMENGMDFGFKLIIAIPPYQRSHKKVQIRPVTTFTLSNDINADSKCNSVYKTTAEQNNRTGWFSPDIFFWGHNLNPDVTEK